MATFSDASINLPPGMSATRRSDWLKFLGKEMAATPPRLEVREQLDSRGRARVYANATLGEGNTIGNATEMKTDFGEKTLNAKIFC